MLRPIRLLAATLVLVATSSATAFAAKGFPEVHTPQLATDASVQEFGGIVSVPMANSDQETQVLVCVSERCRRLPRQDDGTYSAAGDLFGVNLRRGHWRTVVLVIASNPSGGHFWGPARVRVR